MWFPILLDDWAVTSPSREGDLLLLAYDTEDSRQQWTWEDTHYLTNKKSGLVLHVKTKKGETLRDNIAVIAKIRKNKQDMGQQWILTDGKIALLVCNAYISWRT